MKRLLFIFIFCNSSFLFSQTSYLNDDGTISDYAKRQLLVETFKTNPNENVQYDIEDNFFVITTKSDCGEKQYEGSEMQKTAMIHCFGQLLNTINGLKKSGYNLYTDISFEGIIFKTNSICMYKTRRYHFKFNFIELNKFPEYLDFEELFNYVTVKNENKNIIYVKNDK